MTYYLAIVNCNGVESDKLPKTVESWQSKTGLGGSIGSAHIFLSGYDPIVNFISIFKNDSSYRVATLKVANIMSRIIMLAHYSFSMGLGVQRS